MCVCFVRWACAWVRVCVRVQVFLPLFIAVGSVLVAQFMAFCVQCAVWNHPSRQSTVNMVASYSVEGYVPMMLLRNVRRRTMHVGGGCVVSSTTSALCCQRCSLSEGEQPNKHPSNQRRCCHLHCNSFLPRDTRDTLTVPMFLFAPHRSIAMGAGAAYSSVTSRGSACCSPQYRFSST